jgi:hypothetical protein
LIRNEYEQIVETFGLVRMDATQNLVRQQKRMRELVAPHLDGVMRVDGTSLQEALRDSGLLGRYLEDARKKQAQA